MIVNKYELANKSLDEYYAEIASRTRRHKENPPHIVFTIGTARSGTTASLNVFRGSIVEDETGFTHKIPVNYQVFNAGLRHAMLGWKENSDWNFQFPKTRPFAQISSPSTGEDKGEGAGLSSLIIHPSS